MLNRYFWPVLEKAGLPRIRFHDLRHSAATLLVSRSIHPKVVSEMLAHSQINFTMDQYSHVLPAMQREAAAVMEAFIQGQFSPDGVKNCQAHQEKRIPNIV